MLVRIKNNLLQLFHSIRGSIGTYPALIAFGLMVLAILFLRVETPELTRYLKEKVGLLIIDNADTARSLLSTLIGGVISLMVFSFSMVMILLNQASTNYSPRLLPGLISNKRHQFVLGFYIGTILFNILCLINVLPGDDPFQIPAFTVLVGILLGPVCLVFFVFFIHSISQAIQINNILERLYRETAHALQDLRKKMQQHPTAAAPLQDLSGWHAVQMPEYGRLVNVSEGDLVELAREKDAVFRIGHPRGLALMEGEPVLYADRPLDKETEKLVLDCLHFGNQEIISENFLFGFKQLTEIVLRAMSPGINDPGTAMDAIDFLTELLSRRMQFGDELCLCDQEKRPRLYLNVVAFQDLVYYCFSAIRTYVAHDPVLVQKMLVAMQQLRSLKGYDDSYGKILLQEQQAFWEEARRKIENPHDLQRLQALIPATDK